MLPRSLIVTAGALALLAPGVVLAQAHGRQAEPGTGQPGAVRYQENTSTPAWSPDGKRIAFVRGKGRNSDIYVMNADGTHRRKITKSLSEDAFPSWSPDGKTIAFTHLTPEHTDIGAYEIYAIGVNGTGQRRLTHARMGIDGKNQRRLTHNPASDAFEAWSPDGNRIAFLSDRSGRTEVYVMRADGTDVRRLTRG